MVIVYAMCSQMFMNYCCEKISIGSFYIGLTLMEIQKLAQVYAVKPEHNILMSWTRELFELSSTTIINKP